MPAKSKQSVAKALSVNNYSVLIKAVLEKLTELDFFIRRRTAGSYRRAGQAAPKVAFERLAKGERVPREFLKLAAKELNAALALVWGLRRMI